MGQAYGIGAGDAGFRLREHGSIGPRQPLNVGTCGKIEKDFAGWWAYLVGIGAAMELRHLRYFIAVAEAGSLTVAAEQRLHTAQPSLGRQIRDLEEQVGVEMMDRNARGLEVSGAGSACID